ncbi:hypothetical protein K3495_g13270 [Podosphaera aphanis]|nr:hypothetical protein K3495_g13270 [Podosphaera aphanis]
MQYSSVVLVAAFGITNVFGHGVIASIAVANNVNMPGLSGISLTSILCEGIVPEL